ncbi:alpha/beta hydrolase [Pseudohalocynthiibacter sp. F2068]|jgi:pimeloyl-ACP methyl ester carboxylesterase|uniref:alpha/beta fold hydrolase n=1 Tax=Pseudohalocynthiibacter sp. F2068 TaxID=2926418 RepID=UPI001FF24F54|nr:alpha/beta hydrolase [Pseudohalocynthiibacter sp. F2068]MCK0103939.1 alpha/beta hydrolase [Pseudohalocynthiibacter sp. F2068]
MNDVIDCEFSVEGSGPPLFLIHGIGAARNTWRNAMPLLRTHFTVVTYDLRGHGTSPMPMGEFGLDVLVDDLERVRERSGFEAAHFAGHSLGGMIGPAYALKYPDRVLSLGLLSTAAFRTEDDSAKVWGVVRAMEEKGIPQVLETLTDRWFTDAFIENNKEVVTARLKQVVETDPDVFLNVFRIYAGTEMAPWLHNVNAPSLVLTGENDGGCNPRLNRLIDNTLPNSELVILPGYKHSLLLEAGDIVAEHVIRFIESLNA